MPGRSAAHPGSGPGVGVVQRHGGGALPVYLLRRQVTIPARLGFSKTFRGQRAKRRALYARKLRQWSREAK